MPSKFITVNGVRKLNPAYKASSSSGSNNTSCQPAQALPFPNRATALPVVSAPFEDEAIVLNPAYDAAVTQYHTQVEPEIFIQGENNNGLDELNVILAKYEVPAGLLAKLLKVRDFDMAEIIVDDSGSMTLWTDAKGPNNMAITRWTEAQIRISQMMELLAYVVSPPIVLRFLNRTDTIELKRLQGEPPKAFLNRAESLILQAFSQSPNGTTPALEAIQASLNRYPNLAVLRYFFGDGVPNGGVTACNKIEKLLTDRQQPERNPFTFMSCTGDDQDTEWMKEAEERAPYCAEFDDFGDESREILRDQGSAFPYSFGLHLVGQIVAAFNPHDLDAMDESVPFTKETLELMLGYCCSNEEFKYYFDNFLIAQRKLRLTPHQRHFVDRLPSLYDQFVKTGISSDIPAAAAYKRELKSKALQERQQQLRSNKQQYQEAAECCITM